MNVTDKWSFVLCNAYAMKWGSLTVKWDGGGRKHIRNQFLDVAVGECVATQSEFAPKLFCLSELSDDWPCTQMIDGH